VADGTHLHHHRRSVRLRGYDYGLPGAYFVTLCTYGHEGRFGEVVSGQMQSNAVGELVAQTWVWLAGRYGGVRLGVWVLMPNHVHGIIELTDAPGRGEEAEADSLSGSAIDPSASSPLRAHGTQPGSLSAIVQTFKAESTRRVNRILRLAGSGNHVWQRNYYEHVVRNEREYRAIQEYILTNPAHWASDTENRRRAAL
jgi:putative transposase